MSLPRTPGSISSTRSIIWIYLDCNAGSHGHPFATNFNPEINIREVTQPVRHWEQGEWVATPAIIEEGSIHFTFDYPVVGPKESYLLYHEELESLVRHIKGHKKGEILDDLLR